ncbi:MAG: hypothetical protein JXB38_02570, partial [Anaerolineales bacterium]|nr:hypothetical protein [Anaerolineales bacterium]
NQRIIRLKASRRTRWRKLHFAHEDWDNLITITTDTLSGSPRAIQLLDRVACEEDCGQYIE